MFVDHPVHLRAPARTDWQLLLRHRKQFRKVWQNDSSSPSDLAIWQGALQVGNGAEHATVAIDFQELQMREALEMGESGTSYFCPPELERFKALQFCKLG
jgi:hypothetical protein